MYKVCPLLDRGYMFPTLSPLNIYFYRSYFWAVSEVRCPRVLSGTSWTMMMMNMAVVVPLLCMSICILCPVFSSIFPSHFLSFLKIFSFHSFAVCHKHFAPPSVVYPLLYGLICPSEVLPFIVGKHIYFSLVVFKIYFV